MYGDPAACRRAAASVGLAAEALAKAESEVDSIRAAASFWHGDAGEACRQELKATAVDAAELGSLAGAAERALTDFAGELDVVRAALENARGIAVAGGLSVVGDTIARPGDPGAGLTDGEVQAHNRRVTTYNEAFEVAEGARTKEERAHEAVSSAMSKLNGDGWVENLLERLGFAPPDDLGPVSGIGWGLGLGGLGLGTSVSWMIKGRYGVFQPRVAGRFASAAGMGFWQRAAAASRSSNWHATAYRAGTRARWATAGRWASRAGYAVTAVTSGFSQWQEDADDPSLTTSERAGRAVTMSASTTAGAWAGAEAGAWVGGAIGTAICPGVGTVVGGALGGIVGGFVGSQAGEWAGEQLLEVGEEAGEAVGDLIEGAGDVASDVGDAITFWD